MAPFLASLLALLLFLTASAAAQTQRDSLPHRLLLKSGDSFRALLVSYTDSTVTVATEFGTVTIDKDVIESFIPVTGPYRRRPLHFLMPTGSPAGPGGFVSNYELGLYYGGFGLGYGATITGALTLVPGIPLDKQLYHVGAKFTIERDAAADLAVGAAYTWISLDNPFAHIYAVGTFPAGTARYSAMLMYRVVGPDVARGSVVFFGGDTTTYTIYYSGSIGAAFGFDAPAFGRDDMMWVGEIWNNDVTKPQNTVSMLGVRVMNETLSADFGIAVFTAPFVAPVFSFAWKF